MSRGIIEAQTLRSEQFEFEGRTSDPADAEPGEYWIRTDQTSTNPDVIAQLRRQDNSGVTTCPIFADGEEANLGADVTRGPSVVLDDGSVGFIVMTTGGGEVGSPRAVNDAGAEYVSHNALELNTIADSVVWQLSGDTYSSGDSTWVDDVGNQDVTITGDPQSVTLSDGSDGVDADGVDDYGQFSPPSFVEGSNLQSFAFEFTIQTTITAEKEIGVYAGNPGTAMRFALNRNNDGDIKFYMRDENGDDLNFITDSGHNLNDGNVHTVAYNVIDASANDTEILIDGTSVPISATSATNPSNFGSFSYNFYLFAVNFTGSVNKYMDASLGTVRWHDSSISGLSL